MEPLHQSRNFEHSETITYVNNSSVIRLFLFDNTSEAYYKIKEHPYYIHPYQDAEATRIATIGKSTLIVTFSVNLHSTSVFCGNIILINKDGKEFCHKKYEKTDMLPESLHEINNIKNTLINELRQIKHDVTKKELKESFTWCGDQTISSQHYAELFTGTISPVQPILEWREGNELHIYLNGEKSILNGNSSLSPIHLATTYDEFDKCIFVCSMINSGVVFE
jgi:hypothetical protein